MVIDMGEMADMALGYALETEEQAYDYLSGSMSLLDAYENGIIDELGYATQDMSHIADRHWDDITDTDNQLKHSLKDLELASHSNVRGAQAKKNAINAAAKNNLFKPRPTCNWCGEMMTPRNGKYGKFYFCDCPEQGTVSDKYWQSVRKR